jgi:hypothetical protein
MERWEVALLSRSVTSEPDFIKMLRAPKYDVEFVGDLMKLERPRRPSLLLLLFEDEDDCFLCEGGGDFMRFAKNPFGADSETTIACSLFCSATNFFRGGGDFNSESRLFDFSGVVVVFEFDAEDTGVLIIKLSIPDLRLVDVSAALVFLTRATGTGGPFAAASCSGTPLSS